MKTNLVDLSQVVHLHMPHHVIDGLHQPIVGVISILLLLLKLTNLAHQRLECRGVGFFTLSLGRNDAPKDDQEYRDCGSDHRIASLIELRPYWAAYFIRLRATMQHESYTVARRRT